MFKLSYIRQIKNGKWRVFSKKGKTLGTYNTKQEASDRLKQIEMFKSMKESSITYDLFKDALEILDV